MNKIRQILLFLERGASGRSIEKELHISRKTIGIYQQKFLACTSSYTDLLKYPDSKLEELISLKKKVVSEDQDPRKAHFNNVLEYLNKELRRTGVTRYLLWQEYIKDYPAGFQYSRFCELLQEHKKVNSAVMQFSHVPAKLLEVDFAGDMLHYVDTTTGELIACPVFVCVLPYSGYGYVEALPNAQLPQLVKALNNALDYFGGVPLSVRSDNMKQWVTKSCKYEPIFSQMMEDWASHNNIALLASRVFRPKDKPSVENNVKITYTRIYATLRNEVFQSLSALNVGIQQKLEAHHKLNFQKKTFSRQDAFIAEEKGLLQPLRETAYKIKHYTKARVQKNYHVMIGEDTHYYSVPCRYIGKDVRIVYCVDHVEIYYDIQRIAVHPRSYRPYAYTTQQEHMPENHQATVRLRGWNLEYYLKKAEDNGPSTLEYFKKIAQGKQVAEQSQGIFLGLFRLLETYGGSRLEAACERGLKGYRCNYKTIETILKNNQDLLSRDADTEFCTPEHANIRGPQAYK